MAKHYIALSVGGISGSSPDTQADLTTAVTDAIDAAATANAAAGAKADVTAELAAVTAAVTALSANQLTGAVVVSVDLSLVTTKNKLRQLLDEAYRYFADGSDYLT
jgi:hypothetical protein